MVAIFISLIVVAYIHVKRTSSAINRPSDNGKIQQSTTGSITTEMQDDRSSLPAYESDVITTDNPAYKFNVITTDNPAYNVTNNSAKVEDNAEYMYISFRRS